MRICALYSLKWDAGPAVTPNLARRP